MSRLLGDLEHKLQCKLHNPSTALGLDLAEVIDRVLSVAEPASRIAHTDDVSAITTRTVHLPIAHRFERQEDVASSRVGRRHVNLRGIRLVENVEESGAELNLLLFSNVEVLEEGDVKVAPAWRAQIERWLRWSRVRERRDAKLRKIERLAAQRSATDLRIAKIERSDSAETGAGIRSVESIRTIPADCLGTLRQIACESQTNRRAALDSCNTRDLPMVEDRIGETIREVTPCQIRDTPVVGHIEHVSSIEGQDTPASISRVDRIGPRGAVAFGSRDGSQRLAEGIGGKVLEASAVMTESCLQRVIGRRAGELIQTNRVESIEGPEPS